MSVQINKIAETMVQPEDIDDAVLRTLKKWSVYLTYAALSIGALALAGWQFNIDFFKRPIPGLVAMNPLTALLIICCAISILFIIKNETKGFPRVSLIVLIIVITAAVCHLLQLAGILQTNIDHWLFYRQLQMDALRAVSNHMSPSTAINFLFLSVAILQLRGLGKTGGRFAGITVLPVLIIGALSLTGYFYSIPEFHNILFYLPMAVHTAICFIFMAMPVIFISSRTGLAQIIVSAYAGGSFARKIVPLVIFVPVLWGFLRVWAAWNLPFSVELGGALLVGGIITSLLCLVWYFSVQLNQKDKARKLVEHQLEVLNKELEQNLLERTGQLDSKEKLLASIVNSSDDAIISKTMQGIITSWNKGAEKLLGYTEKEIIGKAISVIIPAKLQNEEVEIMQKIKNGELIEHFETERVKKDGFNY